MLKLLQKLGSTMACLCAAFAACAIPNSPLNLSTGSAKASPHVLFVENAGQWDGNASFAVRTFAGMLFITSNGQLVYRLNGRDPAGGDGARRLEVPRLKAGRAGATRTPGWVVTEQLVDAENRPVAASARGMLLQPGRLNYSIPRGQSRNLASIPSYERVSLGEVYEGIVAEVRATGSSVEKIFTIAPGADPDRIRIRMDGLETLERGSGGDLIVRTGNGPVTYSAPVAFQTDREGNRVAVPVSYALDEQALTYGFSIGRYDPGRVLVIDPILQSTYVGGTDGDVIRGVAVHPVTGDVYVTGYTESVDFPTTAGAASPTPGGQQDAFVTRFNPALTQWLQSTYLGGSGNDEAKGIAIHPATGEVYLAGVTNSTDFPNTAGSEQPSPMGVGATAGFVARLDAALTTLLQSSYIGGSSSDYAYALAIHPATGDVYVAGSAASIDFPKTAGSEQPEHAADGGVDAYIMRFNAALTSQINATYLGGNSYDAAKAIVIHPVTGEIYVTGETWSTNFPKAAGSEQPMKSPGGLFPVDGFVTRLDPELKKRLQSTYLGGDDEDLPTSIAVHPVSGEVYVAGITKSTNFPKVAGAEVPMLVPGARDGFAARLDASLKFRLQATYLGGNIGSFVVAVAIHPMTGEVYLGSSTTAGKPKMEGAAQPLGGGLHAFISRVNAALTQWSQTTFLGGDGMEEVTGLAIHLATGDVYIGGSTTSTNLPQSEQTGYAGNFDGFVSRISLDLRSGDTIPDVFYFSPRLNAPPGSQQTATPAQITGISTSVPVYVSGGNFAQYCISTSECSCDIAPFTNQPGSIADGQFACVRQSAPIVASGAAVMTVTAGGRFAQFMVTTGNQIATTCSLDIDGNNKISPLTDGLLFIRALFGLTGTAVTNNAIGSDAARRDWPAIRNFLNGSCGTNFAP